MRKKDDMLLPIYLGSQNSTYESCLVGYFLTTSIFHFPTMRNMMVNLFHPIQGVQISYLGDWRYLFKFFHEIDIERVINGVPWTFNNHLLIIHRLEENEDLICVPLVYTSFWIQVHDLPLDFFGKCSKTNWIFHREILGI